MPGAFLKGNSIFPGSNFVVNDISKPWNSMGSVPVRFEDSSFGGSALRLDYYVLKRVAVLNLEGSVVISTAAYGLGEGDTSYLYEGDFKFPDKLVTEARFDIGPALGASAYHFQNVLHVSARKMPVFFDVTETQFLGSVHIDGVRSDHQVVITCPSGFLPHRVYNISGSLVYERR